MLRNVAVAAGNSRDEKGEEKRLKLKLSSVAVGTAGSCGNREGGGEGGVKEEEKDEAEEEELVRVLKAVLKKEGDEMVQEHLKWAIGRLEGGREEREGVVGTSSTSRTMAACQGVKERPNLM